MRMSLNIPVFVNLVLNIVVYVYCKNTRGQQFLKASVQEEENFDIIARSNAPNTGNAGTLIKQRIPNLVDRKFLSVKRAKQLEQMYKQLYRRKYLFRRNVGGQFFNYAACKPRVTAVQVPGPALGYYYPNYILLHRCAGGCYPSDLTCSIKATASINVMVLHVDSSPNASPIPTAVPMLNHTDCGCECSVQPSHCNNDTQTYDEDSCECKCRNLSHTCDNTTKHWNHDNCRCECNAQPIPCGTDSKIWDPETCQCECLLSIRKRCIRKKKLINTETCSCYCSPDITCPTGKELDKSDCSCVDIV